METLNLVVTISLSFIGIAVSFYVGRVSLRTHRERSSVSEFLRVRRLLKEKPGDLRNAAAKHHGALLSSDAPTIARPGWILQSPIDVDELGLVLDTDCTGIGPSDSRRALHKYWPTDQSGRRFRRYHEAVAALDRPLNWFNGICYRMLDIRAPSTGGLSFRVGVTQYWEGFDTTEALAHEAAYVFSRTAVGHQRAGSYQRRS
jgi:hypothetical protein